MCSSRPCELSGIFNIWLIPKIIFFIQNLPVCVKLGEKFSYRWFVIHILFEILLNLLSMISPMFFTSILLLPHRYGRWWPSCRWLRWVCPWVAGGLIRASRRANRCHQSTSVSMTTGRFTQHQNVTTLLSVVHVLVEKIVNLLCLTSSLIVKKLSIFHKWMSACFWCDNAFIMQWERCE